MEESLFETEDGRAVTAVAADEMRAVDRVAVEEFGVDLLQMMENAGRNLARQARAVGTGGGPAVVVAGDGGNGGGGLACARHLVNHGVSVRVVLDRPAGDLSGAAANQHATLAEMGVPVGVGPGAFPDGAGLVVDALVGYGLDGEVRGPARDLVESIEDRETGDPPVLSLDVPSGLDATTGETHGVAVDPDHTLTLALPKTGLDDAGGTLTLADIAVPAGVYDRVGVPYGGPFEGAYRVPLVRSN